MAHRINMSCGQTDLYPECLADLGVQLGGPLYYPPYKEIEDEARELLKKLMNTENGPMLIPGSATYGEEAAMISVLEPGDKVLTVITGTFGQVLADLARLTGAEPVEIKLEHGHAVDPGEIEQRLSEDGDIKMVAVVHVETSMGTMNPVGEIGEILKKFPDVLYMVDTVSSLGGTEVRVDDWGIDVCCTSPQKCLNAPQGVALVTASEKAWRAIKNRRSPMTTLCLDLFTWRGYHGVKEAGEKKEGSDFEDRSFQRETEGERSELEDRSFQRGRVAHGPSPSYVLVKGLRASLRAIFDEGPENVFRRHRLAAKAVREALRAMGLRIMAVDETVAAPVCTKIVWPEGFDNAKLLKILLEEHGVVLGGDRIGTMGFVARPEYVLTTISALERSLLAMGQDVPLGAGISAANRVFAQGE